MCIWFAYSSLSVNDWDRTVGRTDGRTDSEDASQICPVMPARTSGKGRGTATKHAKRVKLEHRCTYKGNGWNIFGAWTHVNATTEHLLQSMRWTEHEHATTEHCYRAWTYLTHCYRAWTCDHWALLQSMRCRILFVIECSDVSAIRGLQKECWVRSAYSTGLAWFVLVSCFGLSTSFDTAV